MRKSANDCSVYFYNSTITITSNSVVGVSNNGTFNSTSKRDKKEDKTLDNKNTTFSSASMNASYVPYFDSPTSENSIKTKKPYYIDYFIGLGNWIINEVDISIICAEYQASIVKKCKARARLNSNEELALSHVFLFQEENLQGLREFFDDELWQCIFLEIRTQYSYVNISERVFDLCGTVVKCRTEIKSYLRSYNTNGEFEEIMHDILYHLSDNYQNSFVKNNKIEDTHSYNYLDSVIKPFFPKSKKTTMDWANRTSESSAWIKKQFDPILLVNEDLVALGKMMQASLDKSLDDGVDIVICRLHVIGYIGRCYVIDLLYDGIYRLILIREFRFPEDPTTWRTLMSCFQVMATVQ
ncbi:3262_t:CDS:2, partial [Cetraspora pellucida]